ncbi:hypothetical protein GOM49_14525 [Clostridium bovifaecis]|uniref:SbsC C-terminal domain-containing protein n=1 Tax=Clostridium bovifaecis TaxID=2184719 RepID=A0A6I6F760_9CLOT|nr:hypothetical protein GOM49_14525 [Clostridium bovifaecis]
MKSKKIISMVLASGMLIGGIGFSPVKALAATGKNVQVTSVKTQKNLESQAYKLLMEVKTNPNGTNIKAARKALAGITDASYKSAYKYLLGLYTNKSVEKPAIDELILANAMNAKITRGETEVNFGMNLEGKNLSKEEQEQLAMLQLALNNMKVNTNVKYAGEGNTKAQVSGNVKVNAMGQEMKMNIWADVDATGSVPQIKYVVQIPEILKTADPTFANKDYFVFDFAEMLQNPAMQQAGPMPDMGKIMEAANKFGTKFSKSFDEFIKIADAKYDIVERKDVSKVDAAGTKGLVKAYSVTLTNDEVMNLIKDALKDKKMMALFKNYVDDITALDPNAQKLSNEEFYAGLTQASAMLDQISSMIKFNVNFDMGVNKEGYVSYQNGSIKVEVNAAKMVGMFTQAQPELKGQVTVSPDSTYILTINLDSNTTNINGDVKVEAMPKVTKENSLSFTDLMNAAPQPATIQ